MSAAGEKNRLQNATNGIFALQNELHRRKFCDFRNNVFFTNSMFQMYLQIIFSNLFTNNIFLQIIFSNIFTNNISDLLTNNIFFEIAFSNLFGLSFKSVEAEYAERVWQPPKQVIIS